MWTTHEEDEKPKKEKTKDYDDDKTDTSTKNPDDDAYTFSESGKLELGDYEVGVDLKTGTYNFELWYRDSTYKNKEGSGEALVDRSSGNEKKYEFKTNSSGYSEDQRIILKEGDIVTIKSGGGKSDFFLFITGLDLTI